MTLKACFLWKCFFSQSTVAFSNIFPVVSNMQSGWKKVGSLTGLPGFCSNTILTTIHWVGNTSLFKASLRTASSILGLARCMMVHSPYIFGIPSGPGAFLTLVRTRSTATLISAAVNSGGPSSASQGVTTSAGSCGNSRSLILSTASSSIHSVGGGGPFTSQSCTVIRRVPPSSGCTTPSVCFFWWQHPSFFELSDIRRPLAAAFCALLALVPAWLINFRLLRF